MAAPRAPTVLVGRVGVVALVVLGSAALRPTVLVGRVGVVALVLLGSAALRPMALVGRVGVAELGSVGPRVSTVRAERVGLAVRGDAVWARRPAT